MTIKSLTSFTIFLIFAFSYSQDYFEGEVHFKIDYTSLREDIPKELFSREFGDTLIGYVKERKYIMTTNNKGAIGRTKQIILMDENVLYFESEKLDTIYKYPLDKESSKLIRIHKNKGDNLTILGDECPSLTLDYEITDPNSIFSSKEGKYYYNPKYKLSKEAYSNHKVGFWNLFVNESGAISVRNEVIQKPLYKSVMEAFQIIEKKIPDELFEIDTKNKIIKESE